jgi:glucose-6-phosphate dehydrogenase assembly protein OpcA
MIFNPDQIERELERIQRQNSPTEARTAILNLVVFSRKEAAAQTERALGHVVGQRAARVIHVIPTDQAESDVSLSARCYLDRERKSVCVQEIVIENGGDGVGAAAGTWTPLLIRDLPVYAVWFDTISGQTERLQDLQEQCDTLIIDSEQSVAFGDAPADLVGTITGDLAARGVVVSDFVWQRLLPLRRITARYFDPVHRRGALERIRSVEIVSAPAVFGSLYVAWLAERLGWYVEADGVTDHAGSPVSVSVDRATEGGDPAATAQRASVRFTFHDGSHAQIDGSADRCAHIRDSAGTEETVAYEIPQDGEIVISEIDAVRNESLYTEALETLARAPWAPSTVA